MQIKILPRYFPFAAALVVILHHLCGVSLPKGLCPRPGACLECGVGLTPRTNTIKNRFTADYWHMWVIDLRPRSCVGPWLLRLFRSRAFLSKQSSNPPDVGSRSVFRGGENAGQHIKVQQLVTASGKEWSVITITQIASCCVLWLPAVTSGRGVYLQLLKQKIVFFGQCERA